MAPAKKLEKTTLSPGKITGRTMARVPTATTVALPLASTDPHMLLDSLDASTSTRGRPTAGPNAAPTKVDPIEFLNRYYTTEAVLVSQLPSLRDAVGERMERLDERISNALQRQSETADSTLRYVQDSRASVEALEHRIRLVQQKASQSETAVLEITKDMKRLDCAKKHLQRTITTLKRLHMLIHAVEQLRVACLRKPVPDYKSASHLVDATRLLLKHFEAYSHKVEPMNRLSQKVASLQLFLRTSLVRGFRIVSFGITETLELEKQQAKGKGVSVPSLEELESLPRMSTDDMEGAILLVDSLGAETRRHFIHQFCQEYLSTYRKSFQPIVKQVKAEKRKSSFKVQENPEPEEPPLYTLDQVEQRFLWFRDIMNDIGDKFKSVFPSYWNLQFHFARYFLLVTREHLLELLHGPKKDPEANNATFLLKALQKTIVFEKEMMMWLPREFGTVFKEKDDSESNGKNEKAEKGKVKPTALGERAPNKTIEAASTEQVEVDPLIGVASVAFEKYMDPYIRLEKQSMDEQLMQALEDRTVDTRGDLPVFTSSTGLFVYIKGSVTRCNALTKGHAFYLLQIAFQEALRTYSQVLERKLPASTAAPREGGGVGGFSLAGVSLGKSETTSASLASYKIPKGEEFTVCYVVSTCEYCAETVEALEDLIKDTIDEPYKQKIDLMAEQEVFHDLTAKAIRVLVSGLGSRIENALRSMSSINWAIFGMVGEESSYVRAMNEEIHPFVTKTRELLPTPHFRSFCDKFATAFTTSYYTALTRLKKISQPGTQQLLLDVYSLKTLFLKLPILESKEASSYTKKAVSTIAPALYTKMVSKQFNKIETLLKLVGTPEALLIDVFKVQWVGGSALDLQTVMVLKGMKRTDQAAVLEKFGLDPITAMKGATVGVTSATIVSERVQALQDRGVDVASKVNLDLNQMRQKVDSFRLAFR